MNRKQSTNYKIEAIINSKTDDAEEEAAVRDEESRAKIRLRRTSLYGGGARTKIPKIKRKKQIGTSPFHLTNPPDLSKPKPFENSIPPGAHTDMFRVVSNSTTRSMKDPDRIFFNSSSMADGIHPVSQPPWYFGNNNKIKPADNHMFVAASRYGYRGSKDIQQFTTQPWEIPSKTRNEHTPKFLDQGDYINEWVPPIIASTVQTVNGIETPKFWPENTEFVTGYPLKRQATSWRYKRETTVAHDERPKSADKLSIVMNRVASEDNKLKTFSRMESTNSMLSLPQTKQSDFDSQWKTLVTKNACGTLRHTMKREKPTYQANTLLDPSDRMRYSGTTALIVHTQTTDELKFRLRMERSKSRANTPFQLKWQHVNIHYNHIKNNKLKRSQTMDYAISDIARKLQLAATQHGSETSLHRADFIAACGKISFFDDVEAKELSLLYSLFDPMKKNCMRFVELIAALTVLDKPERSPYEKLESLWEVNMDYGQDRNIFDIARDILTCCCMSVPEVEEMEQLFKLEFRNRCYEMRLTDSDFDYNSKMLEQTRPSTAESIPVSLPPLSDTAGTDLTNARGATADGEERQSPVAAGAKKKTFSVQPQYNICEHYLNKDTFSKVLRQCPLLIDKFDSMLAARLVACHGKDDRYKPKEEDEPKPELQDFTWILSKPKPPKREVFGLH